MGTLTHLFIQPFPGCNSKLRSLRSASIAGLIVFFIIYSLRPFGFDRVPQKHLLIHSVFYGLITLLLSAVNLIALPKILPKWFRESQWTVGKELLMMMWQILSISAANAVLTNKLYGWPLSIKNLFLFLGYTSAVGIFPVVILVLLKYITLLKRHQKAATLIEAELPAPQTSEHGTIFVKLLGDYHEVLEVPANNILYISTADNYIQVFYLKDNSVASSFLRSTMKKAELSLSNFQQFFRCHRTYMVNLQNVQHISGNAQGLKIHLRGASEVIPVSRSLNNELKLQLKLRNSRQSAPSNC